MHKIMNNIHFFVHYSLRLNKHWAHVFESLMPKQMC